jgi:hypothetical protein
LVFARNPSPFLLISHKEQPIPGHQFRHAPICSRQGPEKSWIRFNWLETYIEQNIKKVKLLLLT